MEIKDLRGHFTFGNLKKGDTFSFADDDNSCVYMKLKDCVTWIEEESDLLGHGFAVCFNDQDIYRFSEDSIVTPAYTKLIVGGEE